ncbi:MAG: malectin domain-containing carbohydrate-binding protein [Aurantibacter sp.]
MFSVKAQLPDEFLQVDLLTGLSNATTMQFAPDGRIFILDRYGEVLIYKTDTQLSVSAGTVPVFHEFEDGLLGIAFDPNFLTNNYIYLHYSVLGESKNRVSRFTMNGDNLDLNSEIILLDWATQRTLSFHSGGDMAFDSQGNLYVAIGDNTDHGNYGAHDESDNTKSAEKSSGNTNDLRGSILRITPQANGTYTIPSGNLFSASSTTLPEIYVMGARNPYRIFVDKDNTDWLFWGEVGPDANAPSALGPEGLDEMNLVKTAGNYGWPYFSGVDNDAFQVTYRTPSPFYNNPAAPENTSTWNTGATVLPAAQPAWLEFFHKSYFAGTRYYYNPALTDLQRFPVEFDEVFFYYDFNDSKIWAVNMDAQGNITNNEQLAPAVFPTSASGFIDMEMGPDGKMYILAYGTGCCPQNVGTGRLVRVDYIGITTNAPPTVVISADPTNGPLPLTVDFSSVGTTDPDGDFPLTYEWDFDGNGTVDSTAENPTNVYNTAGTFNVQLKVDDGNGGIGVNNITIYAGNSAANFTFNSPLDGGLMGWGDDINFDLTVTDPDEGAVDCNDVNVIPSLGHLGHFHDLATQNGCPTTMTIDAGSHDIDGEMDIFYVLNTNYTDMGGLTAFDQILLHPKRKEAEFFDSQNGVAVIPNTDPLEGGSEAIQVDDNGFISFTGRNLSNITSVKYKVASAAAGGTIEFRVGSQTGTILATTNVPNTGGASDWVAVESAFTDPGGKNDIFFVFNSSSGTQDIFNLNYVEFIGAGVSTDNSPPLVSNVEALGSTQVQVQFTEYVTQATAELASNYVIDGGITVSSAVLQSDNLTVLLTVSPLSSNTTYNLTVSNVQNQAGIPIVTDSYPFSIVNSVRINVGGPQLTFGPDTYIADQYFTGGSLFSASIPIDGTTDDELYQTERFGTFSYEIPVPVSGEYDIRLHFAELFYGVGSQPGGPGTRVFNVTVEGNAVLTNFDILAEVDPATALQKELDDISITDGFASIQFTSVVENPKLSAIEILPPDAFTSTPDISIISPQNGWSVNQPFDVAFYVENWTIQEGDTHIHYYIDGVMVGPYYSHDPISIDGLSIGSHTIRVELFLADHTPTGIFDDVMVAVTDQAVCNSTTFPDSWVVHQLEQNPYTAVYTFADDDLDGDGLKDIVTGGWWYKNPGTAAGNWQKSTIGGTFGNVVHVYDFDGDGHKDLLGTALGIAPDNEYESAQLLWAQNDGAGNFTVFTNVPAGNTSYSEPFLAGLAGGDFGSGYQMAINWNGAEQTGSPVQMLTPTADPTTGTWSLVDISPDSAGEDIQAGDIDGDGDLDLFQGINWLRNNGGTFETFSTGITYVTTPDRNQLADFDRDGDLDAVVGQLGLGSDPDRFEFAWFAAPADPTQTWVRNVLATDIAGSLSVFAIDFDFDGDEDIVVGEWLAGRRLIVFENDLCVSGDWETQIINDGALDLEHHDGARVVDIDNDGDLDVISNGWINHMIPRIYENTTPPPVSNDPIVDAGQDQTVVLPTDSATLNGSATDPDGGSITSYLWTQQSGPNTATLAGETTADLIASDLILGSYVFRLTAIDDENDSGFDEVTVTVSDEFPAIRINSGGPTYTFNGIDWSADQYFNGGTIANNPMEIANTTNDQLYQTERYHTSSALIYEIPVSNGDYDVNLHFAEIFYGVPGAGSGGGAGSRVFNVNIENGQEQLDNYDIVVAAGGSATAVIENFTGVTVNDGNLTITLTGVVEFPKISGIEVLVTGGNSNLPIADAGEDRTITLPNNSLTLDGSGTDPDGGTITAYQWAQVSGPNTATLGPINTDDLDISDLIEGTYVFELTVTDNDSQTGSDQATVTVLGEPVALRINSGGPQLDFNGEIWSADQYFVGGTVFENAIAIANTENDELYQTERFHTSGNLTYEIPVENGSHNLSLHFAEIFHGVPGPGSGGGAGSRVFNIDIENGEAQINNYDIIVAAGGSATAVIESFSSVNVADGSLTITLIGVTDFPKISGIEVLETRPPNVDAGADQAIELPVNSVDLSGTANDPDGGSLTYQWTQESGPGMATLAGDTTLDLAVSDLVAGDYVFRLTVTDDENETGFDEVTVTVTPEGGNMPPVAVAEAAPLTGAAPLEVTFTGSNSTDDVAITTYAWDFGDGGTSTEADPVYTYNAPGTYTVTLTVTDAGGLTSTATLSITVTDGTSGEIEVILVENPSIGGLAKISVMNAPADMMVLNIYLHDVGGRYIAGYNAQDVLSIDGTYDIPVSMLRDGIYFVGVGMNQGKPKLIKLIVDN